MSKFHVEMNIVLKRDTCLPSEDSPQFMDALKESLEKRLIDCGIVESVFAIKISRKR